MMERFAAFHDERRADLIEHEVVTLLGQRVFGIALGYDGPQRPRRIAPRSDERRHSERHPLYGVGWEASDFSGAVIRGGGWGLLAACENK